MRRNVRASLASVVVALLVTACANAEPDSEPATDEGDAVEEPSDDDPDDDGPDDDGPADDGAEDPAAAGGYEHLARALDGEFDGTSVSVLSQWIAEDGERFVESLKDFEAATGIDIEVDGVADYTTTLVARAQGGNPPDLAQVAQPGLMRTLAGDGHLVALSGWIDTDQLTSDFGDAWIEMTSQGGDIYGITWGAFTKSVVWYPAPAFEAAGYEVPTTWDELMALSDRIVEDGSNPWCISVEQGDFSGWPATDWVEDVLLRTAPPETYDAWAAGELPFSDDAVSNAFDITAEVFFTDGYAYGGPTWMNETWVGSTPLPMFHGQGDGPDCWFHKQATWIADFFLADPNADPDDTDAARLTPGEDAKFFVLPPIDEAYGTPVLGAADQFVMFEDRPEVRAVVEYLATPDAVEPMIAAGGFISPNESVPADWYQDYSSQTSADILADATTLRDDASDGMPAQVGSAFNSAMIDWIRASGENTGDILQRLDDVDWEGEE